MQYKINQTDCLFDLNPELLAIPEYAKLDDPRINATFPQYRDRRMRFVMLVADIKTPLRKLPERERRERAARIAGYPLEDGKRLNRNGRDLVNGEDKDVEAAIKAYKDSQWDEDRDTIETKKSLIQSNLDYIKAINNEKDKTRKDYGKDLERANKLGKDLPELVKSLKDLESILDVKDPIPQIPTGTVADFGEEDITHDETTSLIDRVMMLNANQKND